MDYKELAEKAREIDAKATPGPWMWDLRECNHQCLLTTTHSGKYYVMGFQRWGLQDALPSFQVYDRYEGQMKDRGSHGMVRADKLSKSYPGQEHHYGFDNFIDHPDARYIAESRELFHQMATAITELLARAEAAEAAQETLQRAMAEYKERAEKAEQRAKKLDEAMEWAKYASGTWERAYYNAMARAGKAEREAEEERQEATLCRNGWKKAEKELAAAVSDLETVMAYGTGNLDTCIFCKNAQCYARGGTKPCLPKWRGTTPQSRRSRDSSPYTGEP
ncbi:MAG TPA: hypothetical protein IAA53_03190 [Candidatus Avoscillospira avicola]|uniref:Uncharacterized protein n=1 Tax=Candidatus Avoscillospira avicola TaxID=2840706 RepID=A0A9D1DGN1_9FIRM|nr:hypothetical protein [Candidatus Avoscillospira avicola]